MNNFNKRFSITSVVSLITSVVSLIISVTCVIAIIISGVGYRLGLWHFSTGFSIVEWTVLAALISLGLAIIGIYKTKIKGVNRGFFVATLSICLVFPIVAFSVYWEKSSDFYPPINDITTDIEEPPSFWEVPDPVDYPGIKTANLQITAYPEISPIKLSMTVDQAFDRALTLAKNNKWEIVSIDKTEGQIEATDSSFLYGFKDDIVIRVQAVDGGAKIDMRSRSRVGKIDRGANARRILKFIEAFNNNE
ncbi:DUF1499 domain-containing protein [sulfur-oxidizing endosymbiont of Gigantopelta aegis]|uniref:DUF1499 domain-containing protein n=1 Tax=sulfur-oxidizing endosymbiont of Gigantopelta aegis TaxID=2794934 RepID=UPI0018DCDDBC|nr:DUF1499 domain-containing protein [sulfur-oxidizing endosymbiont of Gigantopelta aegis]